MSVDVERLLASLGIYAVRRGNEWTALCPNPKHNDRRPSWRIVDDPSDERHALHHCYPCGFGGDPITLVMMVFGVGYHAAKSWVADYQIEEEDEVEAKVEIVAPKIFRFPAGVETKDILEFPQPFRKYLAKRHVTITQARRWGLAYAIEGRLAGRVVIPTRSQGGRLLSYTARAIDTNPLRYLTPRRDEGSDPGAVFGEEHWGPGGTVAITEGSFDAMAVERAVPEVAVAVLGTGGVGHADDPRVILKLQRFRTAVIVTDANPAGDRAFDVLEGLLRSTARVGRARPPEGRDADSMTRAELRGMICHHLGWSIDE